MSGRSAHVRKKVTEPNKGKGAERRQSSASAERDMTVITDFPMPSGPLGTGVGTTNARFLKFSDNMSPPPGVMEASGYPSGSSWNRNPSVRSGGSSGSNGDPRFDGYGGGVDEYGFTRQRKPTIKTEDVSGIERSGLRSMLDKKSDGVRKGLAKTFAFRKKEKDHTSPDQRPASAATVRPEAYMQGRQQQVYEHYGGHPAMPPQMPMQRQSQAPHQYPVQQSQLPQHRWPGTTQDAWENSGMGPPPTGKLPPIPQGQGPPIKRWIGAGRPVQRWNKLRKDPELWDPNGDVLIFLSAKGQTPRPPPSFRLSSHIIEATESRYLVTLLREGFNEDDMYGHSSSPVGSHPHHQMHLHPGMGRGGQPTPPVSEDASIGDADGQISYEMYFPTPGNLSRTDQLRHQITTRNVFALLYHASLVGITLHQALSDVHTRLDAYMPPECDNVGQIINYLSARGIDDVRSDPETAISLLSWSEGQDVRWEEGWRECFIHCTGMYRDLDRCSDFRTTTPITKALLERACLEMQLRVQSAEERLADFAYDDMWPASFPVAKSPARAAAGRLQHMLASHYARIYGTWPPASRPSQMSPPGSPMEEDGLPEEDIWLTRTIAAHLQKDFGALYDYLVNRDIVWDVSEARSGRKWMMASESGNRAFEADIPEIPMTDLLIEFDNKLRFPHIPHPYPLVPESITPMMNLPTSSSKSSLFKSNSNLSGKGNDGRPGGGNGNSKPGSLERRVHLAYTESTNIYALGSDFTHSDLIDAYVAFEKTDRVGEVDPATARRGRWILIYGILQTLASISVDTPRVRYHEGVSYHLSPRLRGSKIPPWKGAVTSTGAEEAGHEMSHCWQVPATWASAGSSGDDDEHDQYSDGSSGSLGRADGDMLSGMSMSGSATLTTASSVGSSARGKAISESSVAAGKRPAPAHSYRAFPTIRADSVRGGRDVARSRSTGSFLMDDTLSAVGDGGSVRSESARRRETPLLERDEDEFDGFERSRGRTIRDFDDETP